MQHILSALVSQTWIGVQFLEYQGPESSHNDETYGNNASNDASR